MGAIYNLLEQHRLESYYKCLELGVKDERDFLDGVTDEHVIKLVPAGNVNQTELIYNSSETPDVGLIIGITILIVVAAIVIVFVSTRESRHRRGISNDVVLGLETGAAGLGAN